MITTKLYHSLIPIFPGAEPEGEPLREWSLCKNEPFSFQLAYRITDGTAKATPFFLRVHSDLPVSVYQTGCVPVLHGDVPGLDPVPPVGMYPDVLIPRKTNPALTRQDKQEVDGDFRYIAEGEPNQLFAYSDSWQTLWLTVNEQGAVVAPGIHTLELELLGPKLDPIGHAVLILTVLNAALPRQSLIYTNWLHCDCICDHYGVELFSDRFFDILESFVEKAAQNGMNMVLTPCFTPPLDTAVGQERMTVQLVKIRREKDEYFFDFSLLKRFVSLCQRAGIRYFEHSHLFTQWGARHAPKIVAEVDGAQTRIFGWDTDAAGAEYVRFLRCYLTQLRQFLQENELEDKILFHISDEPKAEQLESYKAALSGISDLLEGFMVGDALSDPAFFESGLVKIPIARTKTAHLFAGKGDNIWCYYIGSDLDHRMCNRLIQLPRQRNRYLGVQLYRFRMRGFLHWGYNYYYGELSTGRFDPFRDPCGGFPSAGTSYFVYPGDDGTAWQSIRQKIFGEGLQDQRALELLEALSGRDACEALLSAYFGQADFYDSPETPEKFITFRQELNRQIQKACK